MSEVISELKWAIKEQDLFKVKTLINQCANVEGAGGRSFLIASIQTNHLEITKLLIEAGANATIRSANDGLTPLSEAIKRGNLEMVKLLLDHGGDMIMYENLENAISRNSSEIVRELVTRGVDIHSSDYRTDFPIICAASGETNCEIVKILLENKANVNAVGLNGVTPLIKNAASNNRDCDILKLLVESGARINVVDWDGDTPLIKVVRLGNLPAAKYLIENKAELNVKNTANETPLALALKNDNFLMFKILMDSGADPELAKDAIEEKVKKYPDFAVYMSAVTKPKDTTDPQLKEECSGHEAGSVPE